MHYRNRPFAENGFMDVVVKLAQTAFFDDLPSNANNRPPVAPTALAGPLEAAPTLRQRWLAGLERWMYQQQVREREAYLGQSRDVYDLEQRIRNLERKPYF
jgi:hypothetical protein